MKRQLLITLPVTLFCVTAGWFISGDWGFVAVIVAGCLAAGVGVHLDRGLRAER